MSKNYTVQPSTDHLIKIQALHSRYRNKRPKDSLMDLAQLTYLELKEMYGTNYVITSSVLIKRMHCAESTFNDNFCGGVNGFLAISEQVVIKRFAEAIDGAEADLDSLLNAGFRALFRVNPRSKYNTYQKTHFDMNLRTRFAVQAFSTLYWEQLIMPMLPAIDAFLIEENSFWAEITEVTKMQAQRLFAVVFQWVVGLLAEEDISRYPITEQGKYIKDYVQLYKKMLIAISSTVSPNRYSQITELRNIMERTETSRQDDKDNLEV